MLSLKERFDLLERDLIAKPIRITVHQDLPFAILRYDPGEEWEMRRQARLLSARLLSHGKEVVSIALAELLWDAIDKCEGIDAVVQLEREDPAKHVVFLSRAASMAPAVYQMSKLLEEMHGRTKVPMILFYPGTVEGESGLRFMGCQERVSPSSYRVKIYS